MYCTVDFSTQQNFTSSFFWSLFRVRMCERGGSRCGKFDRTEIHTENSKNHRTALNSKRKIMENWNILNQKKPNYYYVSFELFFCHCIRKIGNVHLVAVVVVIVVVIVFFTISATKSVRDIVHCFFCVRGFEYIECQL